MTQAMVDAPFNDISLKRRAVYNSLFPYFSNEALMQAMWLWQEKYSSSEASSTREFVNKITNSTNNKQHSKKIYSNIMAGFLQSTYESEQDPMELMLAYRSGKLKYKDEKPQTVVMNIPANIIFTFIMENLHNLITKENKYMSVKTREYFSSNIFKLKMDVNKTKEILQWAKEPSIFIGMKYSNKEFSNLLHIFYIGMCEYYGPQKADIYLNAAIELAEHVPEAKEFPPKSFL